MTLISTAMKPWVVERHDQEDGSISYEVWDYDPANYRRVVVLNDSEIEEGKNARRDAYMIATLSAGRQPPAVSGLAAPQSQRSFPPTSCNAWEDCVHDGVCHDPQSCGGDPDA